jgi:SAM-dependent methyltransferase
MPVILSACPADFLPRGKVMPVRVRLCRSCLLGFNATRLDDEALREIYDNYLYISPMKGIGRSKYVGMIETLTTTYAPSARLVEIGCSEGYLLNELRKAGFTNLTGVEPGPQGDEARGLGFDVIDGYFDASMFPAGSVDGFYLMHVFEHFPDPFAVLRSMIRALAPGGAITIEVPDLDGFHHQHLYFYTLPFMRRLCHDHGLRVVRAAEENDTLLVVLAHEDAARREPETPAPPADVIMRRGEARYAVFKADVDRLRALLARQSAGELWWWGAGSAAVVLLNQVGDLVRGRSGLHVVDGDPNKWGCVVPGVNLPVSPSESLRDRSVEQLVIASAFHHEIRQSLLGLGAEAEQIEVFSS